MYFHRQCAICVTLSAIQKTMSAGHKLCFVHKIVPLQEESESMANLSSQIENAKQRKEDCTKNLLAVEAEVKLSGPSVPLNDAEALLV